LAFIFAAISLLIRQPTGFRRHFIRFSAAFIFIDLPLFIFSDIYLRRFRHLAISFHFADLIIFADVDISFSSPFIDCLRRRLFRLSFVF